MDTDTETLSATTTVQAPPEAVFAVLADPTSHAAINGQVGGTASNKTGWVSEALDSEPLTEVGQVFRMGMSHPRGAYRVANQVRELDRPSAISWATGTEDDEGNLSFGGWVWRYTITPAGEEATEVRLTYDWSDATPEARETIHFPPFGVDHLQDSLGRLAEVVTS
jgi:uncharacterized protein YndB with AHSA1/START domain